MELPLVMGKLAQLLDELDFASFFGDKVVIQSYLKHPLLWASSPFQRIFSVTSVKFLEKGSFG